MPLTAWREALAGGPKTLAKKAKGARPDKRGAQPATPRVRRPHSESGASWPAERLSGEHRIGWHQDNRRHTCDFPLCPHRPAKPEAEPAPPPAKKARGKAPASGSMPPPAPPVRVGQPGPSRLPPRPVSPTGSESSQCSERSHGTAERCRLHCLDCRDPSGKRHAPAMHRVGSPGTCLTLARPFGRPMNFHPECWNKWHFECAACL